MKKIAICIMAIALSFAFYPLQSNAATVKAATTTGQMKSVESTEASALLLRLNQIRILSKSGLSSTEKKNLSTEVISIRDQLRVLDGGIYLSVGAIIVILLILIILL